MGRLTDPANVQVEPFSPSWASLADYECPAWFRDAKFGIFLHWGVMSVPETSCWYARQMYMAEGSPVGDAVYRHAVEHYGHPSRFGFKDLIPQWKADRWDPDELVALFRRCGARYVVPVAVHHDNFDNYASTHQPWNSVAMGPGRDIVGEWKAAVERQGLRFGVSSHSDRAWQWLHPSHGSDATGPLAGVPYDGNLTAADGAGTWWEGHDPRDLYCRPHGGDPMAADAVYMHVGEPPDEAYKETWYRRTAELVAMYEPDLLYFDGPLPLGDHGLRIAAEFMNANRARHDGRLEAVLNIKSWGPGTVPDQSAVVLDVEKGLVEKTRAFPWQVDTTIPPDWVVTPDPPTLTDEVLVHNLCDIVSKNGNLLLNVGLRADGTLPDDQRTTLEAIGEWLAVNGEAIYGTRPWRIHGEGPTRVVPGDFHENTRPFTARDIRFTTRPGQAGVNGGDTLYAIFMGWPSDGVLQITSLTAAVSISLVGSDARVTWENGPDGVTVQLPVSPVGRFAYILRITGHQSLFAPTNRLAWCIVPYDDRGRSPAERLTMLERLGFTQYAWDWRGEHLADLAAEIELGRVSGVTLRAVWLWIDDANPDDELGAGNRAVLDAVRQAELPVELWVGVAEAFFEGLDNGARVARAASLIAALRDRATESGGTVALYGHGGWFGMPDNQLQVIEAVGDPNLGIVYNFHHAEDQGTSFTEALPRMLPRLRAVNVSGVRPGDPQVLPIGAGTNEREMLRQLAAAGYEGPLGILGHVEGADVEQVLRRNLDALRALAAGL